MRSSFLRRHAAGVKHLNPRQGITTSRTPAASPSGTRPPRVKHLNPRQGITTRSAAHHSGESYVLCETPKSPPGDYNGFRTHFDTRTGSSNV